MNNKNKQKLTNDELAEIFRKHGLGEISTTQELTGGQFNSVLKVTAEDGKCYVIKIAPPKNTDVLTYENNLIKSEVYFYKALSEIKSVYLPKVFGYNYSDEYKYKYLIIEFIDGQMLSDVKLSTEKYNKVMYDLGRAMAEIHSLPCDVGFGYLQNGLKGTWQEAYPSMTENVINDAVKKKAKTPYLETVREIIEENKDVLCKVQSPSFVHFDLWAGNIIVKDEKLYALIDCERAMLGDHIGDFISLDYAAAFEPEKNRSLIDGYNSFAKEPIKFDKDDMKRLYLMKIYLGLIVFTEQHYRYSKLSPTFYGGRNFGKRVIKNAIDQIKKLS